MINLNTITAIEVLPIETLIGFPSTNNLATAICLNKLHRAIHCTILELDDLFSAIEVTPSSSVKVAGKLIGAKYCKELK